MNCEILNKKEVAEMLRVSPRTVLSLARKGVIPSVKIGKEVLFFKVSILKWLRKNNSCRNQNESQKNFE